MDRSAQMTDAARVAHSRINMVEQNWEDQILAFLPTFFNNEELGEDYHLGPNSSYWDQFSPDQNHVNDTSASGTCSDC